MNLFDMVDPKKAEEAKRIEERQELMKHPERWHTCAGCGRKISPLFECNIDGRPLCSTCYMIERKEVQP